MTDIVKLRVGFAGPPGPYGIRSNFEATRAPLPTDDETQGYVPGSRWMWQGQDWIAVDVTAGAAVWDATVNSAMLLPAIEDAISTFDPSLLVEGTFLPTIGFETPADSVITHTAQAGRFQKIGSRVVIAATVTATITKNAAVGRFRVEFADLPYVPADAFGIGIVRTKPGQMQLPENTVGIVPQVKNGIRGIDFGVYQLLSGVGTYINTSHITDGALTIGLQAEFWT